ncbi:Ribonuclease H-like domain,Domain of unknown function DUF4371 [Cinara cedri]|uniref:DUF4371 domain-containing protein n=1 Tax=Cinara cedri TaxID=506608 RepID=A0A5E4MSL3_9HEMI|nr:Ribonuclease H-like domain,Domain of unknown function DUF4371 [Cinara cedri]
MLGRIDTELQKQVEQEKLYWKTILTRLISVIKFLCKRGLALRGDDELVGSKSNGNYLGLLELLAEYDDFLKKHIQEKWNYSTPDEGHVDQLTVVFRFMEGSKPVERFLKFLPNQGHKPQDMFNSIMKVLENNAIEINNCRGQSYDNASAMSGKYNGLQSKIIAVNKLATWVPCAAHSLNLVGKVAAECCSSAISFFNFLEAIYTFFTASTHRYDELKQNLQSTDKTVRIQIPKRISTTRWSCRSDATKALFRGYSQIKSTLDSISNNLNELPKTRDEANGLYNKLCKLETGIYCAFWNKILDRFNATNKILQDPTLDLNNAVASVKSLKCFINAQRDGFSMFEKKGKIISKSNEYNDNKKRSRKLNIRLNPLDYVMDHLGPQNIFALGP